MNGVFAVCKPPGMSSQDLVGKLKRIFSKSPVFLAEQKNKYTSQKNSSKVRKQKSNFVKIGHGGTLDPMASGVLIIGVGTGTKRLAGYLGNCSKTYKATALFGASTTTYDNEGSILRYGSVDGISEADLEETLKQFQGTIQQLPPVFSALKMDGKPLYQYARENVPLPRPIERRECTISELSAGTLIFEHDFTVSTTLASPDQVNFASKAQGIQITDRGERPSVFPILELKFTVTSGTYIRSLIYDLGKALGTEAHMVKLERTQQGDWKLGYNVFDLQLFDKKVEEWWPALKTMLKDGPLVDAAALQNNMV